MALQKINWTQIDSITVPSGYTVDIGKIDGPIDAIYSEKIYLSGVSISDLYLNGGSFSQGVLTLTSNSGNTITVTGFEYDFDRYTTGFTYNDNNTFTIVDRSGYTLTASFNILTGLTINGDLKVNGNTNLSGGFTATTISASTYQNLPIDPDTYVTSFTYDGANKLTISDNNGTIFDTVINEVTGLTINGDLIVTGKTNLNDLSLNTLNSNVISATTISGDTFYGDGSNLENIVLSVNTGTGLSGNSTTGHITLINTDPDRIVTISGGTGILTGGTYPNFTITNTLPDQIVTLSGGTGLEITGTYPNFNINFTGQTNFPYLSNSGGTVTGDVIFQSGLTANTIYATTYENLPIDPDTYVTGFTYDNNKLLLSDNSGNTFNVVIDNFSGLTINGTLSATTISGGTFYGDGSNLTNIDNIYTVDGTLQSNRIIDLSGKTLSIKRSSNLNDPFLTFLDSSGKTMFEIRSQNINSNPNEDDRNIFIGKDSGALNTTGRLNVAFGDGALSGNTTGTSNTAIGWRAGRDHVDGLWNTFIGMNAGLTWVSGNDNTVVGQNNSHRRTSGTENTFIGNEINNGNYVAIITGGTGNTVLGAYSARLMGGDNNVIIGRRTGANLTTGSGNVFIGRNAGTPETTNSNLLYIENSTTSTPLIWGDFANDLLRFNAKVGVNVQPNTFQFDVNGNSRFSNTVQLDLVNSGITDTKILTLSSGNVVQYRPLSDILSPVTADTYVTGFTYTNNTFKILDNSGSTFTATINELTGLTINGNLTVTGNTNLNGLSLNNLSANTISTTTISGGTFYGVGSNKQVIYNNNGVLDGDNGFVYDGTNVGIGTSSPTNLLHITGSTNPVRIQGLQPSNEDKVITIDNNGVLYYSPFSGLTNDKWISGGTFDNRYNVLYLGYNTGGGFRVFLNITGLTHTDTYVTGGTYNQSTGVVTFVNNSGGTFDVTGFYTGGGGVSGNYLPLSGGTVTGNTIFQSGITTNTIYATTYQNLPIDVYTTGLTFNNSSYDLTIKRNGGLPDLTQSLSILASDLTVTGGTYNPNTGVVTLTNNAGGTFYISGFTSGLTDTVITSFTYDNNTFTINDSGGSTFNATINTVTGLTVNGVLELPKTTALNYGVINVSGVSFIHTYGTNNTFMGLNAGNFVGSGADNVGIGIYTLDALNNGNDNSALGSLALTKLTDGDFNVALGSGTLQNIVLGNNNTAIGVASQALKLSGDTNTSIGFQSLFNNIDGSGNVAIGHKAGWNETGSNKLHIANTDTTTLIYGEFDNQKVGINTTSPTNTLHVSSATDPVRFEGLQLSTDNRVVTTDNNGVLHYIDLSGVTTSGDYLPLSGGTVTGNVIFQSGITATTISGDGSGLTNINNIYNNDGFLQSNRIVYLSGNTLSLRRTSNFDDSFLNGVDISGNTLFEIRSSYVIPSDVSLIPPNLFIGLGSGKNINSNVRTNLVVGGQSVTGMTSGIKNVVVGNNSLTKLIRGSFNTVIGDTVASSFTGATSGTGGDDNVFIGNGAALNQLTGRYNVIVGSNARQNATSGDNNVFLGKNAGINNSGSGSIFIGTSAGANESGSNLLYIENSSSATPLVYGDFTNDLLRFNGKVGVNILPSTWQFEVNGTGKISRIGNLEILSSTDASNTGQGIRIDGTDREFIFEGSGLDLAPNMFSFRNWVGTNTTAGITTTDKGFMRLYGGFTNPNVNNLSGNELWITPTYNITTTGFTTTVRGIYYNPVISALTNTTHIAYQNTTGTNILNSVSGNTLIGTTVDSGNKLFVSGTTDPVRFKGLQLSGDTRILTSDNDGVIRYRNYSDFSGSTVTITGGTNIQITGSYPNFGVNYTGQTNFPYLQLSGGTVTGNVIFQSGITASTIYATTYQNLPVTKDTYTTGGTYTNSTGTLNLLDNSGNTISITGFTKYFISGSTPIGIINYGDRWYNTNEGIELVYINDGNSDQWVQPANTPGPPGYSNLMTTSGVTTSGLTLDINTNYYGVTYSGNVNLTLPTPSGYDGYSIRVKDEKGNAGIYRIRVNTVSGLIDGNSYVDMNINYISLTFVARNGNWWII